MLVQRDKKEKEENKGGTQNPHTLLIMRSQNVAHTYSD